MVSSLSSSCVTKQCHSIWSVTPSLNPAFRHPLLGSLPTSWASPSQSVCWLLLIFLNPEWWCAPGLDPQASSLLQLYSPFKAPYRSPSKKPNILIMGYRLYPTCTLSQFSLPSLLPLLPSSADLLADSGKCQTYSPYIFTYYPLCLDYRLTTLLLSGLCSNGTVSEKPSLAPHVTQQLPPHQCAPSLNLSSQHSAPLSALYIYLCISTFSLQSVSLMWSGNEFMHRSISSFLNGVWHKVGSQ